MIDIRLSPMPRPPAGLLALALLPLLTAACASAPAPPAGLGQAPMEETTAEAPGAARDEAPAEATTAAVTCYYGPSRQILADGSEREGAELLLRHTFEPEASRIVEETVRFDPLPEVRPRLYTTVYQVEGDRFTLEETEGQYSGSGTLDGDPWAWTGWTSDYVLESGIRVQAKYDFTTEDGREVLQVQRQAFGPDGTPALTIEEELAEIHAAACAERMAQAVETDR